MELTHDQSLIDDLIMVPKIDHSHLSNEYFPNPFEQTQDWHFPATNPWLLEMISPPEFNYPCSFGEFHPFLDALTSPEFASFDDLPAMPNLQEEYATNVEDGQHTYTNSFNAGMSAQSSHDTDIIHNQHDHVGLYGEQKSKAKKPNGQPSKNLMAERRRRKRLNDRLSMLRSIVPKISKMDRTSILGDTIDYMRELLDNIHKLREEVSTDEYTNNLKDKQMQASNPPKFDVERRKQDTRVEVCCTAKPGLLVSTLSTLDALGLDIHQCVISCFNDFSLQASCYEVAEHRSLLSSEEVKQALFRNAGYGGRCL